MLSEAVASWQKGGFADEWRFGLQFLAYVTLTGVARYLMLSRVQRLSVRRETTESAPGLVVHTVEKCL